MQSKAKNSAARWQAALGLLVAAFLIAMAASMVLAARRASRVVDADYYNNGLHYGQTRNGSQNAGLGWTMSASLAGEELQVRVKDESGAPVAGGKLRFEPVRGSAGGQVGVLELSESAPGVFRSLRPASRLGELHGALRFTRGEASASQKLVIFY